MFVIFLLAALSVGGLLFATFQPQLEQGARGRKRLQLLLNGRSSQRLPVAAGQNSKRHRRSVEDTLKEIQKKQKAQAKSRSRMTLQSRLQQAGLDWSKPKYLGVCITSGLFTSLLVWISADGHILSAMAGVAGAILLPRLYVSHKRKRRFQAFTGEFANAVDVIVRGVKSGMPIGDCLRVVATEGQEPVRSEFRTIVDDQTLGIPVQEAVERLVGRIPLPETNFLSTVLTIQSQSGGNLTEALGNLSTVLRDRKKMQAKIKAMSAEAKASAGIIGSLPPLVAGFLFLTSPGYISLLFTTTTGNVVLICSGFWMLMGVLVMRKMINFDF